MEGIAVIYAAVAALRRAQAMGLAKHLLGLVCRATAADDAAAWCGLLLNLVEEVKKLKNLNPLNL